MTRKKYISAIEATGGWERFDKIMDGLARCYYSMRLLNENPNKATSLDFRITNYIRTKDYRSWLKRQKRLIVDIKPFPNPEMRKNERKN